MSAPVEPVAADHDVTEFIRVRGLVQGVGFRPTVWRLAQSLALRGAVGNDGEGVFIRVRGLASTIDTFIRALTEQAPPLSRIDVIERMRHPLSDEYATFHIVSSHATAPRTGVAPDAATCITCRAEVLDPFERRYRYPFTNCTHCGPRLSIIDAIPYDRHNTTMREFALCAACVSEYCAPQDRRFHAQPIACHACGPRAWLERADARPFIRDAIPTLDDVDGAESLLMRGEIVAIKGLGGFQLACDATNAIAVANLRARKRRPRKPLALMLRDLEVGRAYCKLSETEEALLQSPAAPIVLAAIRHDGREVASNVAPGMSSLGIMLPNTPLHHLMLRRMHRPIVLTSGNLSDEPQCTDNDDARARLTGIADFFLMNNRNIARRVDDSIACVSVAAPRILRRGRGYAPSPINLPPGFAVAPPTLAMGGELKSAFCLLHQGQAEKFPQLPRLHQGHRCILGAISAHP
jgi:hydrogenase maturation protein HypF